MDQHAAAERINYEKYYEILGDSNQPTTETLIPIMISFTKYEALYLEQNLDKFKELGFLIEPLSETDFVVRELPLWANIDEASDLVLEILTLLIENRKVDIITFRDAIAKQISCKSSIKANHVLNRLEIDSLLTQLNECKNPFTCPHGRPTIISFTSTELEKMFERIQD